MKSISILTITTLILCIVCTQKQYTIELPHKQEITYLTTTDTTANYYVIIYPNQQPYKGYLFLLPGTPQRVLSQTDLPMLAARRGVLTVIPVFKQGTLSLGIDDETQESFREMLDDVVSKHELQGVKFFVGGFSIGGTCAIKYTQQAFEHDFEIKPAAVFAIDPPLDFERFYNSAVRDVRLSWRGASEENMYMINRLEGLMGGKPSMNLAEYHRLSPYSFSDTTQRAIKNLLNVSLRIYTEPDVNWWIRERGQDFSDMNAFDGAAMINELNRLGNENAVLITTENKGFRRPDGTRHPHSWSIVDDEELIEWLLGL